MALKGENSTQSYILDLSHTHVPGASHGDIQQSVFEGLSQVAIRGSQLIISVWDI